MRYVINLKKVFFVFFCVFWVILCFLIVKCKPRIGFVCLGVVGDELEPWSRGVIFKFLEVMCFLQGLNFVFGEDGVPLVGSEMYQAD